MEFTGKVHGLFYPHVCKALVTLLLAARKVLYSFVSFQAVQTLLPPFPPVCVIKTVPSTLCVFQSDRGVSNAGVGAGENKHFDFIAANSFRCLLERHD
jgi:hypothetical protein